MAPTEPAPIPWLQSPTQPTTAANAPAWANRELAPVRLYVRYKLTAADFRRIVLAQSVRQMRILGIVMLVIFGLFAVAVLGITMYLQQTQGRTFPPIAPLIGRIFLGMVSYPLALGAVAGGVAVLFAPLVERFAKPETLELTNEGIKGSRLNNSFRKVLPWSVFSSVERLPSGDLHFVLRYGMGAGLAVPRSAFADTDALARFHDAALLLWRAKGAPVAVAETVRAEFAPPAL